MPDRAFTAVSLFQTVSKRHVTVTTLLCMAFCLSATLLHGFLEKPRDNLFGFSLGPLGFQISSRAFPEIHETVKQRAGNYLFSIGRLFQGAMKQAETVNQHAVDRTSLLALIDGSPHA
jgi:hypothetical protein